MSHSQVIPSEGCPLRNGGYWEVWALFILSRAAGEIPQGLLHNVYKEQIRGCWWWKTTLAHSYSCLQCAVYLTWLSTCCWVGCLVHGIGYFHDPFVEVIVPLLASASHFCQTRSNAFLKSDVWENVVVDLLTYQLRVWCWKLDRWRFVSVKILPVLPTLVLLPSLWFHLAWFWASPY